MLLALSAGDRRRQRDLDAGGHLLECDWCARLSEPLFDRRRTASWPVRSGPSDDADVVGARKQGRELAAQAGFSATELTMIATAISEIARNIVKFAERGEIVVSMVGRTVVRGLPSSHVMPDRGSRTSSGPSRTASAPTAGWASDCPGRGG